MAESTYDRLFCGSPVEGIVLDRKGGPSRIEDLARTVSPSSGACWSSGTLAAAGPGVGEVGLQAHHIIFVSKGGKTVYWNCVLVCWAHHRAVHEGGFRIEGRADHKLRFYRPDGRELQERAPTPWAEALEFLRRVRDEFRAERRRDDLGGAAAGGG